MNRRTILASAAPALLALAELRNAGADPVKSGTCGPCNRKGDCLEGLDCLDHVCGPTSLECGGHFKTCGRHKHLDCRNDSKALCVPNKKSSDRKTTKAKALCKDPKVYPAVKVGSDSKNPAVAGDPGA